LLACKSRSPAGSGLGLRMLVDRNLWLCLICIQTVRFYDVKANEHKAKFDHRAAVLACCFSDANHAFSGGLDTVVRSCVVSVSSIGKQLVIEFLVGWTWKQSKLPPLGSIKTQSPQ